MTSAIQPRPPTLSKTASSFLLDDFANCGSTRTDGRLACRSFQAKPAAAPLWITRIEGCDLDAQVETTVVSFTGYEIRPDDSSNDCQEYAPAATYEGDRVFFAGRVGDARRLLGAIEEAASTSNELAMALCDDERDDLGFEALLFEWPQNDVAVLTLCNAGQSEERGRAVESVLRDVEAQFPGALAAMESRMEHSYSFETHAIWLDSSAESGAAAERAMLAIFDQSEALRAESLKAAQPGADRNNLKNLGRALLRREIALAAQDPAVDALDRGSPRL